MDRYKERYNRRKFQDRTPRRPTDAEVAASFAAAGLAAPKPVRREGLSGPESITSLFDLYATHQKVKVATADQWPSVIRHLVKFLGHDDARAVCEDDLFCWRRHIRVEPVKDGKPRSSKTINGSWLAAVKVTFHFAHQERHLPANPAANLSNIRPDRKVKLRGNSFTREEWRTILKATLEPQSDRMSPERKLSRRWVPWLCAYWGGTG
ncbi:MAG TPA: hypothetical protein VF503_15870 [Sphingobium sp.]|uniref:hypothetical protein n=1 Tax=Sphingobium sp. TaxID=1912891 RepID=UPI002ECFB102